MGEISKIRNASIGAPQEGHLFFSQGWIVCVELNARNRLGGYVRLERIAFLINRGEGKEKMAKASPCKEVPHAPWPEIEKL